VVTGDGSAGSPGIIHALIWRKTSGMPLVISDSSTLIHLAVIGRLDLLKEFYGKITIPPAVWREVVEEGKGRAGAVEVEEARQAKWIEVMPPGDEPFLRLLRRDLNEGEAEVIALALAQQYGYIP
jgi:predicted nucleic acid-binding protein